MDVVETGSPITLVVPLLIVLVFGAIAWFAFRRR